MFPPPALSLSLNQGNTRGACAGKAPSLTDCSAATILNSLTISLTQVPYFHSALRPTHHTTNPVVLTEQHLVTEPHDNIQSYASPTPDLPGDTDKYGESPGSLFRWQCERFTEMEYFSSQFCLTKDLFFYSLLVLYHFKKSVGPSFDLMTDRILLSPGQQKGKCTINPTQLNKHNLPGREISHRPCGDYFRRCLSDSIKLEKNWLATRPGWKFHSEESIWEIGLETLKASSFLDCFRFRFRI